MDKLKAKKAKIAKKMSAKTTMERGFDLMRKGKLGKSKLISPWA